MGYNPVLPRQVITDKVIVIDLLDIVIHFFVIAPTYVYAIVIYRSYKCEMQVTKYKMLIACSSYTLKTLIFCLHIFI